MYSIGGIFLWAFFMNQNKFKLGGFYRCMNMQDNKNKENISDFVLFPEDFVKNTKPYFEPVLVIDKMIPLSIDEEDVRISRDWAYLADRCVGYE
jgi:hypothetical protein